MGFKCNGLGEKCYWSLDRLSLILILVIYIFSSYLHQYLVLRSCILSSIVFSWCFIFCSVFTTLASSFLALVNLVSSTLLLPHPSLPHQFTRTTFCSLQTLSVNCTHLLSLTPAAHILGSLYSKPSCYFSTGYFFSLTPPPPPQFISLLAFEN